MSQQYNEQRKEFETAFDLLPKVAGSDEEFVSPSGLYKLHVAEYGEVETYQIYSRGLVSKIADGQIVADIKRNYPSFWHSWVEHPNGNEYLLCGEDYQGYSVVNLTQETYQSYFPDEALQGSGFCWVAAYPSPDKLMLAVDGCFWACPYEIVFYDFQQPDKLPYKEIERVDINYLKDCEGWIDNETFVFNRQFKVRKSDGLPYEQLSKEEQVFWHANNYLTEDKVENVKAKRPSLTAAV
jgi:hypothetical protein